MAGLGSFMEGFAQGGNLRMDWERQNRRRRKEDADFSLLQDDVRLRNRAIDLENENITDPEKKIKHLAMPEQGEDPFLFRMIEKFKSKFSGKEDRGAKAIENAPVTEAQTGPASQQEGLVSPWAASGDYFNQQQPVALNTGEYVYADGGKVKPKDEVEKPTYTQALKDRTKEVLGLAPYAVKSNKGDLGKAARALEGRKDKIDRAVDGYADGGPTYNDRASHLRKLSLEEEQRQLDLYRQKYEQGQRLGQPSEWSPPGYLEDPRPGEDPNAPVLEKERGRKAALAAIGDYKSPSPAMTGRGGGRRAAIPAAAPEPQPAPAAGGAPSGPALPRGAPSAPQLSAGPQMVDFGQVEAVPEDVPGMSTRDWEQYRAQRLAIAAARGQSVGEVDKEVTQMQMGGFQRYGQQALALMQAGNMRGAATAMRAAFQYFPNGNDVKLGIHQGQIIGYGMDEETGKPVGKPMVLNADTTARMLENFSNPQAWRMWTKDWHSMAMDEKKFERDTAVSEETLAQGRAGLNLRAEANQIAAAAAKTRAMVALNSAVRGGLKPSDLTSTSRYFSEALAEMVGLSDPRLAVALASKAAEAWAANPSTPPATILDMVVEANADTIDSALEE